MLIFDPFTTRASGTGFVRDPFPGNIIPVPQQDKVGARIANYFPAANSQGAAFTNANNYYQQGSSVLDIDQIDGKVDHHFTPSQRLFVRYSYRNQDSLPAVLWPKELTAAETTNNERNRMHNGVIDYTLTPNASTVISLRGGLARSLYFYENLGLGFLASSLGFPATLDTAGGLPMFPRITASGYTTLGNQDNRYNAFMTYTLAGSISKVKGAAHTQGGLRRAPDPGEQPRIAFHVGRLQLHAPASRRDRIRIRRQRTAATPSPACSWEPAAADR